MSKQFSILTTDTDLRALQDVLHHSREVRLLSNEATDNDCCLRPLAELAIPVSKAGKVPLHCYLGPVGELEKIVIRRISAVKTSVDTGRSHLIEIRRSFYDGNVIRLGRFYYENRFVEADAFVSKSPEFCKWADRVMARVRRALHYSKPLDAYVGSEAADVISSGRVSIMPTITDKTIIRYKPPPPGESNGRSKKS